MVTCAADRVPMPGRLMAMGVIDKFCEKKLQSGGSNPLTAL